MGKLRPQIFESLRGYSIQQFRKDIISGTIVGVVALPLSLAFAIAAGVSPEKGLITAILFGTIVALLGGTSTQIGGPTGAFVMIVASVYAEFGLSGLIIASIMGGLLQITLGLLRLGNIFKFIPYPIMIGLNTGIAISIFSSQIKDALGLHGGWDAQGMIQELSLPVNLLEKWIVYFQQIHTIDWMTLLMTALTIVVILLVPRFFKKFPPYLFAIIFMTALVYALKHWANLDITTLGDRFSIEGAITLQEVQMPDMDLIEHIFPSAITIAVMGSIVSIVSCSVADGVTGERHNSNMQLIAEGVGNIFTPLFGGIPATGAVARTMVGINNGGRTPIVGLVHAVIVLLILLFLGSLAQHIPTASLAGMLMVVAYNMANFQSIKSLMKSPKSEVAVLWTTVALAVVFNLSIAVQVGVLISLFLFLRRVSDSAKVSVLREAIDLSQGTDLSSSQAAQLNLVPGVEVFEIDGPFFFGMANKFDEEMRVIGDKPIVRVLRMRKVPFIDSTGIHNLDMFLQKSKHEQIQVVLSGVRPNVLETLENSQIVDRLGREHIFDNIQDALAHANEWAQQLAPERKHKHKHTEAE